ncbi:M23 family metallopeptidase, partial [Arthrobacter sp. BL-252-APC-1A]|nr:M23 family metallopeptidase [Arthrobacter sp. BL-252-APC-1A]
ATRNAQQHLHHGSSTTTMNDAIAHSEANHPSADCYQPDGRVQLVPGEVNLAGWAKPGAGPVNGEYGPRETIKTPAGPTPAFHFGIDLEAGGCEGPIWAAQAGTVSQVFQDISGGWIVEVDHGGGVVTWYVHMYSNGILVEVGDKVEAGQMIARVGSSGMSTACHLHFEVHVSGDPVDPASFLAEVGITY